MRRCPVGDLTSNAGWRLVGTLAKFRDMPHDALVAATATDGGGVSRLTYGDLALLVRQLGETGDRLDRIVSWHARQSGPGGMVGDYCTECGHVWPCDTRRMAEGSFVDEEEA